VLGVLVICSVHLKHVHHNWCT